MFCSSRVHFILLLQVIISAKQTDICENQQTSRRKSVDWNFGFESQENIYSGSCNSEEGIKKRNSPLPHRKMSSEEQKHVTENLQLDDEEEVVSKYFVHKEKVTTAEHDPQSTHCEENEKGAVIASEEKKEGKKSRKSKKSGHGKGVKREERKLKTGEETVYTRKGGVKKDGTNDVLWKPQTSDVGVKSSTVGETDVDVGQNIESDTAQKLQTAEASGGDKIEYTSVDIKSPESVSAMERDTDEDMGIYLSNSQDPPEEKPQLEATREDAESSQQLLEKNEKEKGEKDKKNDKKSKLIKRFSDRDTDNYRNGYPGKEDDLDLNMNVRFYMGEIPSSPDGALIDDIHRDWMGHYDLLETHHGYIQWLFPIRENGMNWQAQPLQLHEAEAIKGDSRAKARVLQSYRLILDFFGMNLVDEETGQLERSKNWKMCFRNLNWSSHNYLRITRILKCLGELGYEHLKKGFIQFVLEEALEHHTLVRTLSSCRDYWIGTIKNDNDREELYDYITRHLEEDSRHGLYDSASSDFVQTLWEYKTFCWRLLLKLAYLPVSMLWWIVTLIVRTLGSEKSD